MILFCGLSADVIANLLSMGSIMVALILFYYQRFEEAKEAKDLLIQSLQIHVKDLDRFIKKLKKLEKELNHEDFEYINLELLTSFNYKISDRINITNVSRYYRYKDKSFIKEIYQIIYHVDQIDGVKDFGQKINNQNELIRSERTKILEGLMSLINLSNNNSILCKEENCNADLHQLKIKLEKDKLILFSEDLTYRFVKLQSINKTYLKTELYHNLCDNHKQSYGVIKKHLRQNSTLIENFNKLIKSEDGMIYKYTEYSKRLNKFLSMNKKLEESEF